MIVMLLASALVSRIAYAAPVSVAAQLRAVACCTEHRGALPSQDDAGRCCGVASDAQDPARTSAVTAPVQPMLTVTLDTPLGASALAPVSISGITAPLARGGPPLFLALLTLRN